MKILFSIAEQLPTHRADVTVLFGKYLPQLGITTDVVTTYDPDLPAMPGWIGGQSLAIKGGRGRIRKHARSLLSDFRLLWLAGRGYDAVQVRDKAFAALLGLVAARIHGIPFYYWMSFPMAEAWIVFARERGLSVGVLRWVVAWLRGRMMRFFLYRVILPRADHVFVQSKRMQQDLQQHGIDATKTTPVPMGVDPALITSEDRATDSGGTNTKLFVYLGTLSKTRSPEVMIQAMDLVKKRDPSAQLLLIGETDEPADRAKLEGLIQDLDLSAHVQITGWKPNQEAIALARHAVAGLSPIPRGFIFDCGSPTKAVEYFALGLPVIANDQPDQAEVLAAAGGSTVKLNAEAFAAAMLDVLTQPERYQAQAQTGRQWVRAHRYYDVIAQGVRTIYQPKPQALP